MSHRLVKYFLFRCLWHHWRDGPNVSSVISRFVTLSRSWKTSWHLIKEYPALFSQIRLENILTSLQEYPVMLLETQISKCWDILSKISSLSPKVSFKNAPTSRQTISQHARQLTCMQCQCHIVEMSISYLKTWKQCEQIVGLQKCKLATFYSGNCADRKLLFKVSPTKKNLVMMKVL